MSIGSAFDAYAKSYLHDKLFGKNHADSARFSLEAIFEAQVESQHREWAFGHGNYCFQQYKNSGALLDLLTDLHAAKNEPRFEFEVRGVIGSQREASETQIDEVVFLGKPDCYYINKDGNHVILDWKVNGYCSKSATSPKKGYVRMRGGDGRGYGMHKECIPMDTGGMIINTAMPLEAVDKQWARQLSIYAWLLGEPVGGDFIVAIDQIVAKPIGGAVPELRVAEHRTRVSADFQKKTVDQAKQIWALIRSGHLFPEMTLEDSKARCEALEERADSLFGDHVDPEFRKYVGG